AIACAAGAGLMLESPTWRANPDWGQRVGYDDTALERVNRDAVIFLRELARLWSPAVSTILVSGMIGPRADGYRAEVRMSGEESGDYHRAQVQALAGADLVTAYTLTHAGEAIGIATAAREVGVPVAISFTVETDGRLPDGSSLANAIDAVDRHCPPDWFLVNCAHPQHLASAFAADGGSWRNRIGGLRVNASTRSHAELDEATELDDGDPVQLAAATNRLRPLLPNLAIVGGCCGTDARHVAAQWAVPTR
ncbi:MAG: homocysteine S-methyltransferase family protein, partial [Terracoccus sp.]